LIILSWNRKHLMRGRVPLRGEFLAVEHLEEHARTLAGRYTLARERRFSRTDALARLREDEHALRLDQATLARAAHHGEVVPPGAEWLLDNRHIIDAAITDVARNLPPRYYGELPRIAARDVAGMARIHALAIEFVRRSDARFDLQRSVRFLNAFQSVAPLALGELWAWPSIVQLCLIQNLSALAEEMIASWSGQVAADEYFARFESSGGHRALPELPADPSDAFVRRLLQRMQEMGPRIAEVRVLLERRLEERGRDAASAVRAEHQRQTVGHASIGNSITSLRLVATIDWSRTIEQVSLVEQVLRRDPSGVYPRMDFTSRDRYRHAVEELADPNGEAQLRVALRAVESARQAAEPPVHDERAAHVGYHLIGPGRRDFEVDVAFAPRPLSRPRRWLFRHATLFYLGMITVLTALAIATALRYAGTMGASGATLVWVALVTLLPASQLGVQIVQRLVPAIARPRTLPRLEFDSIPAEARTMVVVPTLLTSVENARAQVDRLEIQALANADPRIHFALLTDFTDSTSAEQPEDEAILKAAIDGIERLNARYDGESGMRFHLFHRQRRWNPRQGVWMGWERKRGKIEEFNRLLRGATDTSLAVVVGRRDALGEVRYCITLDADTRLPRDTARRLIGIAEHPLNRPRYDARLGRVVQGYGILQPRVGITLASASGSPFARVYSGHTGVDPYTRAVSDVYQDLFGEGIFAGKGLYHVDTFLAALEGRVPENALLSHDLFEGLHARCALVSDVEVVDEFPSSVLSHAARQRRWVRGDWQILAWLFPWVPARDGITTNTLPLISRWKILDNLRRSLLPPGTLALLASAWTWMPGRPAVWAAAQALMLALPILDRALTGLANRRPTTPWRTVAWNLGKEVETALAQVLLDVTMLAYQAWLMVQAIAVTLARMVATRRRLLEWESAAAATARVAPPRGVRPFARGMWAGPVPTVVIATAMFAMHGRIAASSAPFLFVWFVSPFVAFWLS
jgi:cyclic beta-1,2-glucan synthetase